MPANQKLWITIGVIIIVIIVASIVAIFSAVYEKEETIKIGFVGPLTGDAATFGLVEKNVIEIALDEINSEGGINGKKLEVIYEDGKCKGNDAVSAAQKLINIDKVKIILACCSAENLVIAPIAEEKKVILFASYANNPAISEAGDYVFRNSHSDEDTGKVAAETIYKKYKRIGIIYELTSYPVGLKDALKRHFEALGGEVLEEGYPQNSKDLRTQITKLLSHNPKAIFVDPNTPATGIVALRQLREMGFTGEFYGNFFGGGREVIETPEADGMIFFAEPAVEENEVKARLFQKYKEFYGEDPYFEYPAAARYDCIYILKEAMENVGYEPSKIKDYLYQMESFTGALGTYRFDEKGDVVGILPSVKRIKDGKITIYENM